MLAVRCCIAALMVLQLSLAGCSTQQIARFENNVATMRCAKFGEAENCALQQNVGVTAFNAGEYDQAAAQWNEPARRGDSNAQYNLGLLWKSGLGSTPKDPTRAAEWFLLAAQQGHLQAMVELAKHQLEVNEPAAALSWFNLAARWNSPDAIAILRQMSAPVPAPDLYQAQQQQLAAQQQQLAVQQQQANQNLGQGLGLLACALVSGGAGCGPPGTQPRSEPSSGDTTTIYQLRSDVLQNWEHICRYADGTVINSGRSRCPASITGR